MFIGLFPQIRRIVGGWFEERDIGCLTFIGLFPQIITSMSTRFDERCLAIYDKDHNELLIWQKKHRIFIGLFPQISSIMSTKFEERCLAVYHKDHEWWIIWGKSHQMPYLCRCLPANQPYNQCKIWEKRPCYIWHKSRLVADFRKEPPHALSL